MNSYKKNDEKFGVFLKNVYICHEKVRIVVTLNHIYI